MMIEVWEKEFFEWKNEMESKFNKLSQENVKLKAKLNEAIDTLNFVSMFYEGKGDYAGNVGELE